MKSKLFGELVVGDIFAYGSKLYTKRLGVCGGIDYNAEDNRTGDYWEFNNNDEVFFIKTEVKQEETANV